MMIPKLRVLILEKNELSRALVNCLLNGSSRIEVVGQASGCSEALEMTSELRPDVLVLGESLPEEDAARVRSAIQSELPQVRIVDSCLLDSASLRSKGQTVEDVLL